MVSSRFLEESPEVAPDAIRIMLTGYTDSDTAIQAINEGGIHRCLTKPASRRACSTKARAQGKPLVTHADDAYICAAPILRDEEILAESLIRVDDLTD